MVFLANHKIFAHKLFHKETIAIGVHDGCGLDITRPRMFYHESLKTRASTKILPRPRKILAIRYVTQVIYLGRN